MPTIGISGQSLQILHQPHPQRIQVYIANQLGKIAIAVAHNRFVPVLKQRSVPAPLNTKALTRKAY
jgi:hypothetical protein